MPPCHQQLLQQSQSLFSIFSLYLWLSTSPSSPSLLLAFSSYNSFHYLLKLCLSPHFSIPIFSSPYVPKLSTVEVLDSIFSSPHLHPSMSTFLELQFSFPALFTTPNTISSFAHLPAAFLSRRLGIGVIRGLRLHSVSVDSAGGEPGQAGGGESQEAGLAKAHTLLAFWQGGVAWRNDPI